MCVVLTKTTQFWSFRASDIDNPGRTVYFGFAHRELDDVEKLLEVIIKKIMLTSMTLPCKKASTIYKGERK